MLAVFFVLFGTDQSMFVAMITFGITPTLTQSIYQSAKYDVQEELINKAYTLGASNTEVIFNVITMQIMPRILQSIRLSVGPAMVALIASEYVAASVGLGYRLRIQSRLLNMALVTDYILILGAIGWAMDASLSYALKKICPWFK
jgi:NitT/TauT family transport system permease protein